MPWHDEQDHVEEAGLPRSGPTGCRSAAASATACASKPNDLAREAVGCNPQNGASHPATAETVPSGPSSATMAVRQSVDPNTDWSERARAATWFLVTCDPVTGG